MSIQPVSSHPREISVTEAIEPAYERAKRMLFKPFDLEKWIIIGFCAWLAGLGESGGGGTGFNNFYTGNHRGGEAQPLDQFRQFYHEASDYVLTNLYWIVPVTVTVVLVVMVLWLLLLWLSSRGKFMFLYCVALDKAEVAEPWKKFSRSANSLFWFRVAMNLIGMVLMLPLLGFIAVVILQMVLRGEPDLSGVMTALGLGLGFFLLSLAFALIHKFLVDFVVPIMFLRGGNCMAAWREFGALLAAHFWKFALYVLFQIVLNIVIGVIVLMAILLTCCIAGCLLAVPFVGTVLLLPVLVFKRAYPLYFLAQFGGQYNVFPAPPAPPVAA